MNQSEFMKEIEDYVSSSYIEFQKYQKLVNGILDEFHLLCKKDDIPYFVSFGSLLGMIRDGGNIPWDYDIDVVVPIDYRERLIEALNRDLGSDYYYVYDNNLDHYPATCLRVCKKGYTYMAFHVDVFFLFGCPNDDTQEQDRFMKKIFWAYYAREAHNSCFHSDSTKENRIKYLASRVIAWIKYPISNSLLRKYEDKLYFKYALRNSERCMIYYPLKRTYSTSSFITPKLMTLNGKEYNVPSDCDLFLRERYGEYKEYLPISDRFDEFYKMFRIINERQDYYLKKLKCYVEK